MTLTIGGREIPATHRPLLRMLLTLSDTPMDDMMTSLTMAANLIPTAVVLTGAGDVPGRDGYVYRPADMGALAAKEENRLPSSHFAQSPIFECPLYSQPRIVRTITILNIKVQFFIHVQR